MSTVFAELVARVQQADLAASEAKLARERAENRALRLQAHPGGLNASELLERLYGADAALDATPPLYAPKSEGESDARPGESRRGNFPAPPKGPAPGS